MTRRPIEGRDAIPAPIRRSARTDLLASGLSRLVLLGSGFATGVVVARYFGPEGRGQITLVSAVYGQVALIFTLGVDVALVHFVGRERKGASALDKAARGLAFSLGLLAATISVVLVGILAWDFGDEAVPIALAAATAAGPLVASMVLQGQLVGLGRLVEVAGINSLRGVFALVTVLPVALGGLSAVAALAMYALAEYVVLIVTIIVSRRAVGPSHHGNCRDAISRLIKYGLTGHVGNVAQAVNYRLDIVLLGAIAGVVELGKYSVAVVFAELLWVFPLVMKNYVSHRMATSEGLVSNEIALATMRASIIVGAFVGAVLCILPAWLITPVFGAEFSDSVQLLWILIPGALAMALYQIMMSDVMTRGNPGLKSVTASIGCIVTLVLCILLIPRFGAHGAAVGTSVAYIVTLLSAMPSYRRITASRYRDWVPRSADVKTALRTGMRRG